MKTLTNRLGEVKNPIDVQGQLTDKVSKNGDTMAGDLILNSDPSVDLGAATKQYVDGAAGGSQIASEVPSTPAGGISATNVQDALDELDLEKVSEIDHDQMYFVGKHGNDSNDGLTEEKAFLTFGAAVTAAEAETPTVTNRFVLYCNDAGVYTEDITTSDWIDIKATSAVIDGNITVGNNTSTRLCTVNKVIKSASNGKAYVDLCLVNTPDGEVGVLNSGTSSDLLVFARKIIAPLNGIGLHNTAAGSDIHTLINDLDIEGNNGIGVQVDAGGVFGVVEYISEVGAPTGTIGIKTTATGEGNLVVSVIDVDTAYDIAASTVLRLTVQKIDGTETVADGGNAAITQADKTTDDLAATGMVNGGGTISLNADITKVDISSAIYYIQGTRYVYAGGTAINPDFQVGEDTSNLGLDSSGLVTQIGKFTSAQKQTIVPLGLCTAEQGQTGAGSDVELIRDDRFIISEVGYVQRLWQEEAIGTLYASGGLISENGTTPLQLDQAAGILYDKQRKRQTLSSDTDIEAIEFYHVSGSWAAQTKATLVIDVLQYDDGTDLATLSNPGKWASHTLLKSPKGATGGTPEGGYFLIYSQGQYDSQGEAEAAAPNYGPFVDQATSGLVAIAQIAVNKNTANINAILDKRPIISATSGASSVTGTATLQQTYDNSSSPEILTDATRGALTVQRGSASDTDNVFEGKSGAGVSTFVVRGDGSVGVGTDTPAALLDVSATGSVIRITDEGTSRGDEETGMTLDFFSNESTLGGARTISKIRGFSSNTTGTQWGLAFDTFEAGVLSEKMRIDANGNVGIGTSTPNSQLEIAETSDNIFSADSDSWHNLVIRNKSENAGNTAGLVFELNDTYHVNAGTGIAAVKSNTSSDYDADLAFITRPKSAEAEERVRITNTGNVGIGTTAPDTILNVRTEDNTILRLENSASSLTTNDRVGEIDFYANDGSTNGAGAKANIKSLVESTAGSLVGLSFGTSDSTSSTAVERMRISSTGRVGIGVTVPTSMLDVRGGTLGNANLLSLYNANDNEIHNLYQDSAGDAVYKMTQNDGTITNLIQTSGDSYFNGGSIGIGVTSPVEKLTIDGVVASSEQASSPSATSGYGKTYWKTDGKYYMMDDAGAETEIGAGGGGGAFSTASNITSNSTGDLATDDFVFGSDQLDDDGDTDHDSRFFFDKSKGSFRAGKVSSTSWNDGSVGFQSFASGSNTEASATTSSAFGTATIASGDYSFATGSSVKASDASSFAHGQSFENDQKVSIAVGYGAGATDTTGVAVRLEADSDQDNSKKKSIYLGQTVAPTTTTNRLYNIGGNLYWNGTQLN